MLRRQEKQRRRLQGLKSSREQIKEAELSVRWDSLLIYLISTRNSWGGLTWCAILNSFLILSNDRRITEMKARKCLQLCSNTIHKHKKTPQLNAAKQNDVSLSFRFTRFSSEWHRWDSTEVKSRSFKNLKVSLPFVHSVLDGVFSNYSNSDVT